MSGQTEVECSFEGAKCTIEKQINSSEVKIACPKNQNAISKVVIKGLDVEFVPNNIADCFSKLKDLTITGTSLKRVTKSSLRNLSLIKELWIGYSKVKSIEPGAFDDCVSLERLFLAHNEIRSLPTNIFDKLTKLTNLGFDSNEIEFLDAKLFKFNSKLSIIYMGHNPYMHIDERMFWFKPQTVYLDKSLCIDEVFNNNHVRLKAEVRARCSLYTIKTLAISVNELKDQITSLTSENQALKASLDAGIIKPNLDQLNQTIETQLSQAMTILKAEEQNNKVKLKSLSEEVRPKLKELEEQIATISAKISPDINHPSIFLWP